MYKVWLVKPNLMVWSDESGKYALPRGCVEFATSSLEIAKEFKKVMTNRHPDCLYHVIKERK